MFFSFICTRAGIYAGKGFFSNIFPENIELIKLKCMKTIPI